MFNFKKKIKEIGILDKYLTDYEEIIKDKIKDNNFLEQIKLFKKEKNNLLNINRFCIPIIGKCNSGKSTFLNYLLKQKVLEINEEIATNFICIIRHDSKAIFPKIYEVNIKERIKINNKVLYNFEEGKEINGNIEEIIKKKNKELIEESKAKKDYFLLLKINIPFFNDYEFAPYSDCFELMDIPGLSIFSNFYINELIPYFINNAKFCIFLFDAELYNNGDTEFIFNEISEKFENKENIFNNSIFILNKNDKVDKESELQNFEDYMEKKI